MDRACYLTRVCLNGLGWGSRRRAIFKRYVAFENNVGKENTLHIEVTCNKEKDLTQKRQILVFFPIGTCCQEVEPGGSTAFQCVHGPVLPVGLRCQVEQWGAGQHILWGD